MTTTTSAGTIPATHAQVDVRGPRFGAAITAVVLAIALIAGPGALAAGLLLWQAIAFGIGATRGITSQPYALVFRRFVRPRLGAATEFEDVRPPQFAQAVGFVFAAVGLLGLTVGSPALFFAATAMALGAAFLNAAFGFCLGCEMYLRGKRVAAAISR